MKKCKRKIPLAFLSFAGLYLLLMQFLEIYQLESSLFPASFILLICLIASLIPSTFIKLPFYLVTVSLFLMTFLPSRPTISWSTILETVQLIWSQLVAFFDRELNFIPLEAALLIILLLLVVVAELQIEYEWFLLGTGILLVYLFLMTTFNSIDVSWKVIVVLINGFLMRLLVVSKKWQSVVCGSSLILAVALLASLFARNPIEQHLVNVTGSFRNHLNQQGFYHYFQMHGLQQSSRTGFSEDDRSLGGPLIDDRQIVFEATEAESLYWRVESKAIYNGQGWENTMDVSENLTLLQTSDLHVFSEFYQGEFQENRVSAISFYQPIEFVPIPYGAVSISTESSARDYEITEENQRINSANSLNGSQLEMTISEYDYQLTDLTNIQVSDSEVQEMYVELPDSLPENVRQLAEELTENAESIIEKVLIIESYLKDTGNFRYSKTDTPTTPKNQDYVAHFLFDSKVGYCDNFSTAMVVLLRSIGIPARWTKGFSPGEQIDEENGQQIYAIRNSNAHSWVEVFFEGYGWLPFEPTPTFSQRETATSLDNSDDSSSSTNEPSSETTSISQEESTLASTTMESEFVEETPDPNSSDQQFWTKQRGQIVGLILLVIGGYLIWRFGFIWRIKAMANFMKEPLPAIYPIFLNRLAHQLPRAPQETLKDYAQRVESQYPFMSGSFMELTEIYQQVLYGAENSVHVDKRLIYQVLSNVHRIP